MANGVDILNGEEPFYWKCPECEVIYINNLYCARCDQLGDEDDAKPTKEEIGN